MGLQKNVAAQKWRVFAFNKTNGNALAGDAANITGKIAKDWAGAIATNDVNPTETEDGYYNFDLTQAETNADALDLFPESATPNIQVIGVPGSQFPQEFAKLVWDRLLTGAFHNIVNSAGRIVRFLKTAGTYSGGLVYLDTLKGSGGTTPNENGTDSLPVDNLADANTIRDGLALHGTHVAAGSTITFVAAQENQEFMGRGWTLATGGQSVAGSHLEGAVVSGISTGAGEWDHCELGVTTFAGGEFTDCGLEDTVTLSAAAKYAFINCHHDEAGAASTIDFGAAVGATEVHIHDWHGNLTILNMKAGDILHFTSADGTLTLDSTCTAGTVNLAGTFGFTNSGSGQTINDNGQMYQLVAAVPQKNVAFPNLSVFMVDSADHVTPKTGLTLGVTRSLDKGAFAAGTGTAAEVANGLYEYDASQADMNADVVDFRFTAAGADDTLITIHTRA